MTTFELREVSLWDEAEKFQSEILTLAEDEMEGILIVYTGQQGDHTLSIIPSLNVSGYGIDERIP